jgi:hypothetical protein
LSDRGYYPLNREPGRIEITQMRKMTKLAMPIVFASILLGGCGSGGKKPLTKAEFVSKANVICAPFKEKLTSELKSAGTSNSFKEDAALTSWALPLWEDQVARLKKLVPPNGQQKVFDRAITLSEESSSDIEKLLTALRNKDAEESWTLTKRSSLISGKRDVLFMKLGAMKCIYSPTLKP